MGKRNILIEDNDNELYSGAEIIVDSPTKIKHAKKPANKQRLSQQKRSSEFIQICMFDTDMYDLNDMNDACDDILDDKAEIGSSKKDKKPKNDFWKEQSSLLINLYLKSFEYHVGYSSPTLCVPETLKKPVDCDCAKRDVAKVAVFTIFARHILNVSRCIHCPLMDTLILMQVIPAATINPESRVHFSVFEFLHHMKKNAFVSNHAFRRAMDSYNLILSNYSLNFLPLPAIFNLMNAPRLGISMDGNFQLKRRKQKNSSKDPADLFEAGILGKSKNEKSVWGSLADVNEFAGENFCAVEELDSEFEALKNSQGNASSKRRNENGVFNVSCARHGCVMRLYDIFKGEERKYPLAGVRHILSTMPEDQKILIMYDIVCACIKDSRAFPELSNKQLTYYYRYLPLAKTDGESVERYWSFARHCIDQVRSMGKLTRHALLTDIAVHFNDCKMDDLPQQINKKFFAAKKAVEKMNMNAQIFVDLGLNWKEHVDSISKNAKEMDVEQIFLQIEDGLTFEEDEAKFAVAAYKHLIINQPGYGVTR
ncbi:hypothetical protein [Parasitella parasitica]|uniref:CxC1-like cysteine cluster associated with KDZ transposases domain-containing protein n=1 Tax=Parasitella parasitica TaxID=35722 RepID=A0A0B7N9F2_9FUNG|nr:hypothetical protein [Parasitella parasitica]